MMLKKNHNCLQCEDSVKCTQDDEHSTVQSVAVPRLTYERQCGATGPPDY